ncbi:MAG TPA: DUF4365 domain-containing protein [Anaerolineales bacterium]|nr:DUF4365 domain-containing protein [Anaerolineales bacterium]
MYTNPEMASNVRFTPQLQQEQISRKQLSERFIEFGWKPTAPFDLGEDFIVDIYFEGKAAGVNFYVQLKSVTNLEERRKGDYLVYDFEVKDLKYWENFSLPVVLIVWDVKLREGRWVFVDDAIKRLNEKRSRWRKNKSRVRVYLPWINTTNNDGFIWLKKSIGRKLYPVISMKNPLDEIGMVFKFSNTDEGQEAFTNLERSIKYGDETEVEGKFIENFGFPDWWMRWFGDFDNKTTKLILGPTSSSVNYPTNLTVIRSDGETALLNVQLEIIKSGTERVEFSNYKDETSYFLIHIALDSEKGELKIKSNRNFENIGRDAYEAQQIIKFQKIVSKGGKIRINFLTINHDPIEINLPAYPKFAPNPGFAQFVNDLWRIQDRFQKQILVPTREISPQNIFAIRKLIQISQTGKTHYLGKDFSAEFKKPALELILDVHRSRKPIHFTLCTEESDVELFGQKIPTGLMTQHITGPTELSVEALEAKVSKLQPDESMKLNFPDVDVVEIFSEQFVREANCLSRLLIKKFLVSTVYLFGSLVWSEILSPDTDIDLAVSGLPPEKYLDTVSFVERKTKFPIDLIMLEQAPDALRERILREGELLIERESVAEIS